MSTYYTKCAPKEKGVSMVLRKLIYWATSHHRTELMVRKNGTFLRETNVESSTDEFFLCPSVTKCALDGRESQKSVCDISTLLRSDESFFPYFMLVAFEGGSFLRAFLLLLSYPLLWVLSFEFKLRVMIFITFCGLRLKDIDVVGRAVLPKFYLENLNLCVYEVFASAGSRLVVTSLPRIMVEGFLKQYLSVDIVRGTELRAIGPFFTGLISGSGLLVKHSALQEVCGEKMPDIGIGSLNHHDQQFVSLCKEAYLVNKDDRKTCASTTMPRERYPKPLIFHDGRLAFFPTPLATLKMFTWFPFGIILAIFRISVANLLPNKIATFLVLSTGGNLKLKFKKLSNSQNGKGALYVCNHRTLLDPIVLCVALDYKPLTAVTYSLSKFSELLSPIRTVRLTRNRDQDAKTIRKLLSEGDLVICPEGTTCREPYLLRFSSLFAELTDEIIPVAVNTHVSMFNGTTASGFKWLDLIFLAMNPNPCYSIQVLDKLPKELTVSGGKSSHEVANYIQRNVADALGFECTTFTRRDKYLILAGNEGLVEENNNRKKP
ncbi:hypothetical protein ACH5RR_028370 [Cinchona calisaya]|uniref:Phospholipid/glycerol acyltransferase domain-containing protein n=1 Tax=Cinchona calisaya TaxID=153742 RepID=A0ABD2YQH9_9GENT